MHTDTQHHFQRHCRLRCNSQWRFALRRQRDRVERLDRAELERGQRQAERERTDHNESLLVAGVSAAFSAATTCSCGLGTAMISVVLRMLRNRQQGRVDYNVELVFKL